MDAEGVKFLAAGLCGSLGMVGPALGLGMIGSAALGGVARNPEAGGRIFTSMILIAGLAEAIGIYALILGIILAMVV